MRSLRPLSLCAILATAALASPVAAAERPHGDPVVRAARAAGSIAVDGLLDEEAWEKAPVATGFLQRDPDEGQPATEETALRIVYQDDALYVGARLSDSTPSGIVRQLSRRDTVAEADSFSIFLDPHHDHLTGVELQVSAAGVQRDSVIYDDNFEDDSWDAVWESAVAVDEGGWTVELRVPFSQLRFPRGARYVWGVNARRVLHRKNEVSWLALVPKNESGLASRMAHLEGMEGLGPGRRLELLPYASARAEYVPPPRPGNPFNDGSRTGAGAGLDVEYGLSTNLSLVAAFNPDFGQVEVDPAVVNLTAYETFFDEKRPFFTEGAQVFAHFGRSGASDYTTFFYPEPQLFYSRRIGRAPQALPAASFLDIPAATTILAAAKVTGRTRGGWTVGILEAVAGREFARLSDGLSRRRLEVEPLTSYFVGRARRELGQRAAVALLATAVNRGLRTPELSGLLARRAYVFGFDGHVSLDSERDWVVFGGLAGSTVAGSRAAIQRVQESSARYYQRPDAPHVRLDPAATSLAGWSGRLGLNKNNGNVTVNAGIWGISPGFEPNDLGFVTQTDRGGGHGLLQVRKLTPDGWTRSRQASLAKWWTWNYGGESQGDGVQASFDAVFRNFWRYNLTLGRSWNTLDDKLTRGGPTTIRPGISSLSTGIATDARRRFWVTTYLIYQDREFGSWSVQYGGQLHYKPFPALTLSALPAVTRVENAAQYLATVADPLAAPTFGARYVFGVLEHDEVSVPLRANLVFSPKLSLQLYVQPLVADGQYRAIRQLVTPRTYDFRAYGRELGTLEFDPAAAAYVIDPDGAGPAGPFRLADPGFDVDSLRLNVVARWEFRPGSAAYLVWTRRRQDRSENVLLVKLAWWLGR